MSARKGTLVDANGMKKCSKCEEIKNKEDFGSKHNTKDKLNSVCKRCECLRNILYRTGCTEEKFNKMFEEQNGECAICYIKLDSSSKAVTPHVDHRHSDGLIRGLLCVRCNIALSKFYESIEILKKAITYLQNYRERL